MTRATGLPRFVTTSGSLVSATSSKSARHLALNSVAVIDLTGPVYDPVVDTYLAIASRREVRDYAPTPIPDDVVTRILDAGRLSGSARNTQLWEFVIVTKQEELAETVYAPENVRTAALVVAIVGEASSFDAGRCAENMLLTAWNEGVGSVPNGIADADAAAAICGGPVKIVLSFGYPARPRNAEARTAEEWSARAKRKPLDELVRSV
jgi:nitroreductase